MSIRVPGNTELEKKHVNYKLELKKLYVTVNNITGRHPNPVLQEALERARVVLYGRSNKGNEDDNVPLSSYD